MNISGGKNRKRLEDVAKFLVTMISISLSIFLAVGKASFEEPGNNILLKISLILWMLSLIVSFLVLFPWRYSYSGSSVGSIKEMHQKVVRGKYGLLIIGTALFLSALSILTYLFLF